MKTLTVFAFIILGFYLIGCIRPHVIISMKKYMNVYVKIFLHFAVLHLWIYKKLKMLIMLMK